eukprot:m.112550 g.112550  ORF g.112550 m.112550 type:complete len:119 (-) comp14092_c0_seq5:659-1015(-)
MKENYINDIVNPQYKLSEESSRELLASECRQQFLNEGWCLLPNFLQQKNVKAMANELNKKLDHVFQTGWRHDIFLDNAEENATFPAGYTSVGSIANDYLSHVVKLLLKWMSLIFFNVE